VTIDQVEGGFEITRIDLAVRGKVPGVDADGFQQAAQGAKEQCPVSKALASVNEITLDAALED
jgi:lipoyl-dependent peroxiredoxin